ncbi:hypothetical protein MKX01_010501 [Papaver californicum]|nr:hypothetical protein MKX01_010501 [Papaver californicum]
MSWFKDPELYIDHYAGQIRLWRLEKNYSSPIGLKDFTFLANITDHLSLVDNSFPWKKSDYDALAEFLYEHDISVNCQGLVVSISVPRDRDGSGNSDYNRTTYFWSHDVLNLSHYGLPAPLVPYREVRYLGGDEYAPVAFSPKERENEDEVQREKAFKKGVEKIVASLEDDIARLKEVIITSEDSEI